jgi:hypothetical protein
MVQGSLILQTPRGFFARIESYSGFPTTGIDGAEVNHAITLNRARVDIPAVTGADGPICKR